MSPILNRISTKCFLAAILFCAAFFWNCGTDSTNNQLSSVDVEKTSVSLRFSYTETPLVDSLVLDCLGPDTLHLIHAPGNPDFSLDLFPSDHWSFKAKIYANGDLLQMGELEAKLSAGAAVNLSIQMHAIVGFVYIEVPLGLNNSAGVTRGTMTLTSDKDSYTIPMTQTATAGIFKSGMLKLGANYDVEITLFGEDGKGIYKLKDKFLLTEDSPVPNLTLNSLRSQVSLMVNFAPEKNVELTLPLPAGYRKPRANELLITEVMAAPDNKDTTQYEFVEIYNGSLDTLILDDCAIGLTSSSSTKFIPLTVSEIPPNEILVLGNPNSQNTPALHIGTDGWNDMGNSKGFVILKCDDITLDSLYYASEPDSLHPNVVPAVPSGKNGASSQLNLEQWKNRQDSTAWKLATPTPGIL
ncbi:MAG: lamin tail domain-containing protein [Fibrobacter sp.]|nr:lamin tail domain-containing protein [Fibrobacter sp.]